MGATFKRFLTFLFALIILVSISMTDVQAASTSSSVTFKVTYKQTESRKMLSPLNSFRTGNEAWYWNSSNSKKVKVSLSKLTYDYNLEKIAMLRAAEIALSFSHTRPNGNSWSTAYTDQSYKYTSAGENIAAGYGSYSEVFEGWKETNEKYSGQGHRRNMLSSKYNRVGIACVCVDDTYYWVQEFAKSSSSNSTTKANDSETAVTTKVLLSNTTTKLTTSDSSITIDGSTAKLPKCEMGIRVKDYWGFADYVPVTNVSAAYKIKDETVAKICNGKIYGLKAGKTTLTVSALSGSKSITITVKSPSKGAEGLTPPTKTTLNSLSCLSGHKLTIKWTKNTTAQKYQIYVSTSSKFSTSTTKTITVSSADTTSTTVSGLTKGKYYYVKIRGYKIFDGETIYGSWSSVKKSAKMK